MQKTVANSTEYSHAPRRSYTYPDVSRTIISIIIIITVQYHVLLHVYEHMSAIRSIQGVS